MLQEMPCYRLVKILVNRVLNKVRMFLGSFVDSNNSKVTLAKLKFYSSTMQAYFSNNSGYTTLFI